LTVIERRLSQPRNLTLAFSRQEKWQTEPAVIFSRQKLTKTTYNLKKNANGMNFFQFNAYPKKKMLVYFWV
jgi:hypothetical protein